MAAWASQLIALLAGAGLLISNVDGQHLPRLLACALIATALFHTFGTLLQGVGTRFNPLPAAAGAAIVTVLAMGAGFAPRDIAGALLTAAAGAPVLAWSNEFAG